MEHTAGLSALPRGAVQLQHSASSVLHHAEVGLTIELFESESQMSIDNKQLRLMYGRQPHMHIYTTAAHPHAP
jgi:hypothetical protein